MNWNFVPWIGEQPYIEMLFWQFYNLTTYARVVGKKQDQYFNIWLLSIQRDKVLILVESRGLICYIVFLLFFLDIGPWIGEQQCIEMLVWHFSNNPDICRHVEKLPEQHFTVGLCSNPTDKNFNCCWNLMKPGSQKWKFRK